MNRDYWQKQNPLKPLFPDIEWNKPEQRSHAGKLVIIGGHAQGFAAVGESYDTALKIGAGTVKVILPDSLKKNIPVQITDTLLLPSNPSGGFSKEAWAEIKASAAWADGILLPGDAGRNSETAILYEQLLDEEIPLTITRDAIDLLKNSYSKLAERPNTLLVLSFAQIQKLFSSVYYPKILTFSMPLVQFIESIHKFTLTYPTTLMVLHNENLIVAQNGNVSSTPWTNTMDIWRGKTAARASTYWLWNKTKPFEAATTSLLA